MLKWRRGMPTLDRRILSDRDYRYVANHRVGKVALFLVRWGAHLMTLSLWLERDAMVEDAWRLGADETHTRTRTVARGAVDGGRYGLRSDTQRMLEGRRG